MNLGKITFAKKQNDAYFIKCSSNHIMPDGVR